jgi:hypothetical protein
MATKKNFTILQGETWQRVIRWEQPPLVYKPVTAIVATAPVSITATGHGLVTGWRAAVVSAGGMVEINATNWPLRDSDYHQATVVDTNTINFNDTNAAAYTAYTSGGFLVYNTPVDLTGFTANMDIKSRVGGAVLTSLTTTNAGIVLSTVNKTITLVMAAAVTDVLPWSTAVYDLDLISATGVVTPLYTGSLTVQKE